MSVRPGDPSGTGGDWEGFVRVTGPGPVPDVPTPPWRGEGEEGPRVKGLDAQGSQEKVFKVTGTRLFSGTFRETLHVTRGQVVIPPPRRGVPDRRRAIVLGLFRVPRLLGPDHVLPRRGRVRVRVGSYLCQNQWLTVTYHLGYLPHYLWFTPDCVWAVGVLPSSITPRGLHTLLHCPSPPSVGRVPRVGTRSRLSTPL